MFYTKPPFTITNIQLSAMDVLVLTTMKNAAKCDTKSELQNPVNLYVFERMLRFRVLLEACLFECLFSPLASPPRQTEGALADFGLSDRNSLWSVDPSGETTGNSFQCRVCLRNQRGALAIVQNCLGPEAVSRPERPRIVRAALWFRKLCFRTKRHTQLSDLKSGKRTR